MKYLLNYQDIQFTSPIFLWIGLGFAVLIILFRIFADKIHNKNKGKVCFTEIEKTFILGFEYVKLIKSVKSFLLVILIVLSALIFAGPFTQKFEGSITIEKIEHAKTVIAVIDMSGSMKYGTDTNKMDSKFSIVRDALILFLGEVKDMRVGVVFFSDKGIPFRRPTKDLNYLIADIESLGLGLQNLPNEPNDFEDPYFELGLKQLEKISRGTNTPKGLRKAGEILASLDMSEEELRNSVSVILFSDLEDNRKEIAEVVMEFTSVGVEVHVLAVAKEPAIDGFNKEVLGNDLVKVYNVEDLKNIDNAFKAINELESTSFTTQEVVVHSKKLTKEVTIIFIFVFGVLILMAEGVFHRLRGGII